MATPNQSQWRHGGEPITALVPPSPRNANQLAYALDAMLGPLGLDVSPLADQAAGGVELHWPRQPDRRVRVDPARLGEAFARISGLVEKDAPRDFLGRVGAAAAGIDCSKPLWSLWACELADKLAASNPAWRRPERKLTVFLTHDVDRVHPLEPMGLLGRACGAAKACLRGRRPERGLFSWIAQAGEFAATYERLMRLEQQAGVSATYFFMSGPYSLRRYGSRSGRGSRRLLSLAETAERYGHRVGLHGCAYSPRRGDYARQRQTLEAATGCKVAWHRNHYLVYDAFRTPALLAAGGLAVDSTCGYHDANAFRAGLAWPYRLWDWSADAPSAVLEMPLAFMDGVCGGSADDEWAQLHERLESAAAVGGTVAVLTHVDRFIDDPDNMRRYEELLSWLSSKQA